MHICPERLRSARERAGLTQSGLADDSGVSQPRISRIESGRANVWPSTAKKLADALGLTIADLMPATAVSA